MEHTYTVALAGNPNVGKSTVFNRLTGLRQHTGNWPGKTVERAEGYFSQAGQRFRLVDLPGTYSLAADSPEEEVAGAFLQSGQADAVIVVVDASCLRRGLILALQLRQQTQRLVLCVNLMDEAARRGVTPQTERLGQLLDVPVVATAARSGKGLAELRRQAAAMCRRESWEDGWKLTYVPPVEAALGLLETGMSRRRAVALLWGSPPTEEEQSLWQRAQQRLGALSGQALRDSLTASVVALAEEIGRQCVRCAGPDPHAPDRRLDRLLTSRLTGFPVMLLLLGLVFYLTIQGANAPSRLLSRWLTALEEPLRGLLAGAPWWVQGGGGGRHLPDGGVGGGGDAASHGHLLPPVHAAGGRRVSAQSGLLHGSVLPGGGRLRAAEPHHGHGLRLQRLRRHRLPHHCQPQRAAGGHPHQLLRSMQRPLPYADRPD